MRKLTHFSATPLSLLFLPTMLVIAVILAACNSDSSVEAMPKTKVSVMGGWPSTAFSRALQQRVEIQALDGTDPILINFDAVHSFNVREQEMIKQAYARGLPVLALDAHQADVDLLIAHTAHQGAIVLSVAPAALESRPVVGVRRTARGYASFELQTESADDAQLLNREVTETLAWLEHDPHQKRSAAAGQRKSLRVVAANADPVDITDQVNQATHEWNYTVSGNPGNQSIFNQVAENHFSVYSCLNRQWYVGGWITVETTYPTDAIEMTDASSPALGPIWRFYDATPVDMTGVKILQSQPPTLENTTSFKTGIDLNLAGEVIVNGASLTGGVKFSNAKTMELPATTIANIVDNEGGVLRWYFQPNPPGATAYAGQQFTFESAWLWAIPDNSENGKGLSGSFTLDSGVSVYNSIDDTTSCLTPDCYSANPATINLLLDDPGLCH